MSEITGGGSYAYIYEYKFGRFRVRAVCVSPPPCKKSISACIGGVQRPPCLERKCYTYIERRQSGLILRQKKCFCSKYKPQGSLCGPNNSKYRK